MNGTKHRLINFKFMVWLFNLGVQSGLPKYVAILGFLQISPLLIPEVVWDFFRLDIEIFSEQLPYFIQHYINGTVFPKAMFMFWVLSPFTLCLSTWLCIMHLNVKGYSAYLLRREARLKKAGKPDDYASAFGFLVFILLYIWATVINLSEPGIFSHIAPIDNRITMILIHGGAIALLLPVFVAVIVTELRVNLTKQKFYE